MSQALLIAQMLIQYGPQAARELVALFKLQDPSVEDWEKVFALCDKTYFDYVTASKLPRS